jgi:xanthine dehydrogenase accessory factor
MASAAARLLFLCRMPVLVLERALPLAVRRRVCFAEAVRSGACSVEGVPGRRVEEPRPVADAVAVLVDPEGECLAGLAPGVLVDGRMAKRNLGTRREQATFVVGLGPGFVAGRDVHAVVETQRGPGLGRVVWEGAARPDTGRPEPVLGHDDGRVLRAPQAGVFRSRACLGDLVEKGAVVGAVGEAPVIAAIAGRLRGLLADGVPADAGMKVGDVDPRGAIIDPSAVSDKARTVAAGVLEAIVTDLMKRDQ